MRPAGVSVVGLWWLACTVMASAQVPTVTQTFPAAGDQSVDPTISELKVTFDRDMGDGFSFTGGGETFPEVTGRPRWVDRRTCVLPVKLLPGRVYRVGINGPSARNFRSADGVPATPWVWTFRTAGDALPPSTEAVAANHAAVDALKRLLRDDYSYATRKGIDWEAEVERLRGELTGLSAEGFAERVGTLLARAQDIHVRVAVTSGAGGERVVQVYSPGVQPNADPRQLARLVPNWRVVGRSGATGRFDDGVVYVLIGSWSVPEDVQELLKVMDAADRIVLDVRLNGGGDELLARSVAGRFVRKPVLYAKHRTRAGGEWGPVQERWLQPSAPFREGRRVVVLQGPANFSSSESFLQMMRAAGAVTVGGTTGGSSGNPKPHALGNGVTVWLPSWENLDRDGHPVEGVGLAPDEEVAYVRGAETDAVLTRGLERVRQ